MNKNKILANTLCASMVLGNITPAFATVTNETNDYEDTTENVSKETEVLYQKAGNYFVTIPKTISLGTDKQSPYSVKVEGDIASDKRVYVSPIDGIKDTDEFDLAEPNSCHFYMHDQNTASPKADVIATVTQNKFYWNFSEVANGYSETNNRVTAEDLTSGTWKGTFDFEINMKAVNGDESHTHSYAETIIKEPTCTEEGEKKLTCSCGDTKTEVLPATGHHIVDGSCTDCDVIVKTVDDLVAGDVSFEKGTILSVKETDTLKVNDIVVPERNFTFDEEGEYKVTVETTDPADPLRPIIININITIIINQETHTHNYTETIIKNATCTEDGEKKLTCSCGDSKTESIPSTGHNYGDDDKCTNCGELNPNHKHNYTETIIKEATCTEDGEKRLTCSCGDSKTETIPATGHNYDDGECTNCGDKYLQHEHNFVSETYNANWVRESDGTNGYKWVSVGSTTNSTQYAANENQGLVGSYNQTETIWKITVPYECTTQIGYKKNSHITADPHSFIYLNGVEIWNNHDFKASSSVYNYKTVTLKAGDNYVKALGYQGDYIELFNISGESEKSCSICGAKPLSSTWNYTLNESDKTITLNQYTGDETDVIVHNTYLVDGTTYKTKIASRASNNYMFSSNYSIKSVKFEPNIDTSETYSIAYMFSNCLSLTNVDISNLDTSNVTDMQYLFNGCRTLISLDLSNLDTNNVTNMSYMFNNCKSLTGLDLSSFDTSSVTTMHSMFSNCGSLTSLDLSSFDTSNVTTMVFMFGNCTSLSELDLSSFNTSKVKEMYNLFYSCTSLNTIYVTQNKWLTSQADTTDMFEFCGTSSVTYK